MENGIGGFIMKIFNPFKKKEEVIVPPKQQSVEEIKIELAEKQLKKKVIELNELMIKKGSLFCSQCKKSSGLYKLNLKKRYTKNPATNKTVKYYICNYCER